MARTTYEFKIKSQNMMNDIHAYLMGQGFQYMNLKGEKVYRKEMFPFLSFIMQPPTFNLTFQVMGKSAVMEAWRLEAGAFAKELPLKNSSYGLVSKHYLDIVNYIENY